jgi:tetratricopeptide (TPR) repeat protein
MIQFDQELNKYEASLDKDYVEKMVKAEGGEASTLQQNKVEQIIKRYNLAVNYCQTNSYDLAYIQIQKVARLLPGDVNVQLLSALICMHEGKADLAAKALDRAAELQPENPTIKVYKEELSARPIIAKTVQESVKAVEKAEAEAKNTKEKESTGKSAKKTVKKEKEPVEKPKKKAKKVVANGSDYDEVTSNKKSFMYLGIGFLIGVIAVCILVIPTVRTTLKNQYANETASYDDQLKAKDTEITSLKAEVEAAQADTKAAEDEVKTYKNGNKALLEAAQEYVSGSTTNAAEKLMDIDTKILTTKASKNLYNALKDKTYATSAATFYQKGLSAYNQKNYSEAESYFLKAIKGNDSNPDYYYYLALSYEGENKTDKAIEYYNKVISLNRRHVRNSKSRVAALEASTATTEATTQN